MFGVSIEKISKWSEKGKVDKIVKALSDSDHEIRIAAIKALGSIQQEKSFNALTSTLRDNDPEIRVTVCEAFGNMGERLAAEHLKYASNNDPNDKVKEAALEALKKINS